MYSVLRNNGETSRAQLESKHLETLLAIHVENKKNLS